MSSKKFKIIQHDEKHSEMTAKQIKNYLSLLSFNKTSKTKIFGDNGQYDGHQASIKLQMTEEL